MAPSCRWTFLGPSCLAVKALDDDAPGRNAMSGRISALALHPGQPDQIVFAGAASGGVWKTTDGGVTWRPLTDRTDSPNVGGILIDTNDPDRIWVGTGEGNYGGGSIGRGAGILRSVNGGESWVTVAHELRDERVTGMAIDRLSRHLFVSATNGVWRSDDGGDNWTNLDGTNTSGLALDDRDPADLKLYAARYGTGIFLSDGSAAWSELKTGLPDTSVVATGRIRIATVPGREGVLYAAYSDGQTHARSPGRLQGIFTSVDNDGSSWTQVGVPASPGEQVEYNLVIAAAPGKPSYVLLGLQRLWRSTDSGVHWSPIGDEDEDIPSTEIHADVHALAFSPPVPPSEAPILWVGTDGGVFRSPDGGRSWQHRNRGLGTMQFHTGAHHAQVPGLFLAGSQDNGTQRFAGHPVWTVAQGGESGSTAIDPVDERRWYASGYRKVARSTNYGKRWDNMQVGGSEAEFYPPFVVAPSSPNVLWFGSEQLHRTDGDGEEWETIKEYDQAQTHDHDFISALAVDPNDARQVYVGTREGFFFRVWHQQGIHASVTRTPHPGPWLDPPNGIHEATITDIGVSPRSNSRVYLVIGNRDARTAPHIGPRFLRSDDGGRTWIDRTSGLPWVDVTPTHRFIAELNPLQAIVIDPDVSDPSLAKERLFVAGDVGVFESLDSGDTWRPRHDGLPNARVYDLQIHGPGRMLRAITYGRGVWELPLDAPLCPPAGPARVEADLFLRDHQFDAARGGTHELSPNPLAVEPDDVTEDTDDRDEERRLRWYEAPDLKVDMEQLSSEIEMDEDEHNDEAEIQRKLGFQVPVSSVAYDGADIDALGFQALEHRRPRRGSPARVYLQVHNRGPDAARRVKARVFWAVGDARNGTLPALPADFWSSFPDGEPAPGAWIPISPLQTIVELRPAEPAVLRWEFTPPKSTPKRIAVLAVVTSDDDPVFEGHPPGDLSRDAETVARENKRVCLRRVRVNQRLRGTAKWKKVLKWIGIGTAVVVGAYGGYRLAKWIDEKGDE